MKRAVISCSGGMDSTSLLLQMLVKGYQVHAVAFLYGQKHKIELDKLQMNINQICLNEKLKSRLIYNIIDLSILGKLFTSALTQPGISVPEGYYTEDIMKQTVVPNRNAIFSSIIYGYALSLANKYNQQIEICLGVHSGDHAIYPDCRPEFYDVLIKAFKMGNWNANKVKFNLPYLKKDKYTILKDALENCNKLDLNFNIIFFNTNTCYQPDINGIACGKCGSCIERIEAFMRLDKEDPVSYKDDWQTVKQRVVDMQNKNQEKDLFNQGE